uniref:Uncharacterized protein n=1 Tax=Ditylenchus dipsaci TaxID=166011 RepID=A0A915CW81_9BILA
MFVGHLASNPLITCTSPIVQSENVIPMINSSVGVMYWNSIQDEELRANRVEIESYSYSSKDRGDMRKKVKLTGGTNYWKREMVTRALERKRQQGLGIPNLIDEEVGGQVDDVAERIEELLSFEIDEDSDE